MHTCNPRTSPISFAPRLSSSSNKYATRPVPTAGSDNSTHARTNLKTRKDKAERIKDLGSPIEITGKALALQVRENVAWIAENTTVIRKLDLEVGRRLR